MTIPVATAVPSVTSRTRRSRLTSARRGTVCAPIDLSRSSPQIASITPGGAADERQQNALRKHLAHELHAAGAEGEPNGELAFPRSGAREQHGGEIRAGNQQHHRHRAEQNHQGRPHPADDQIVQRINGGAEFRGGLVIIRKERVPVGHDRVRFRLRLGNRDAWFQAADDAVAARAARFQLLTW